MVGNISMMGRNNDIFLIWKTIPLKRKTCSIQIPKKRRNSHSCWFNTMPTWHNKWIHVTKNSCAIFLHVILSVKRSSNGFPDFCNPTKFQHVRIKEVWASHIPKSCRESVPKWIIGIVKRSGKQIKRSLKTKEFPLAKRRLREFEAKVDRMDPMKGKVKIVHIPIEISVTQFSFL